MTHLDPANDTRVRVLFVCLGNICRSPAAEALLRAKLELEPDGHTFAVDSAGTGDWHVGELPDSRMRAAGEQRGLRLVHRARQLQASDLHEFDLLVAMDRSNRDGILRLGRGRAKVELFSNYLPSGAPVDVPDPWGGGPDGFEEVLDLLEEGMAPLLQELRQLARADGE